MQKKVLFVDTTHPILVELLEQDGFYLDHFSGQSKEKFEEVIDQYHGLIIRSKFVLDRNLLERATNLEFIARVGAGLENIDVEFAQSRGIQCFNAPEGNRNAVAEQAVAMLLAIMNNLIRADREVRNGIWNRESNRGIELEKRTVGIVGFGNMGSAFAEKLRAFDVNILAYDKYKTNYAPEYVEEVSMETLWQQADVISLHLPLTEETNYLCDDAWFESFKKPILFINTSRGKICQTSSLVKHLKQGSVSHACLDVLEYEKTSFETIYKENLPSDFQYLIQSEQVILSPHIAGWTHESNIKLARTLVEKIRAFYAGNKMIK